jgi:hypothetical protein
MMNEMSEFNRNCRTLVVSFVIAIMAMIPLRFVEVGQMETAQQPTVLGETIVLPSAEVQPKLFEAPYDQEGKTDQVLGTSTEVSCISKEEANGQLEGYARMLEVGKLNDLQKQMVANEVLAVEANVCK